MDDFDQNGNIDTYKVFKGHENEKLGKNVKIQLSKESKSEKNYSIDIEFVFKFLFDSKYGYNNIDTVFKDKLNKVNNEKIKNYYSSIYSIIQDSNKMAKI